MTAPISPLEQGYVEHVCSLPEGRAIIRIPRPLSGSSHAALREFLDLVVRIESRLVAETATDPGMRIDAEVSGR